MISESMVIPYQILISIFIGVILALLLFPIVNASKTKYMYIN